MSWNTKRTLPVAGIAALGLFLSACATAPDIDPGQNRATVIQVQNLNLNRVRVEAVSGGVERRLGEVESTNTDDFVLPRGVSLSDLQILVDPIGPSQYYLSPRVLALPGDLIEVTVTPNLALTTVEVAS